MMTCDQYLPPGEELRFIIFSQMCQLNCTEFVVLKIEMYPFDCLFASVIVSSVLGTKQ